MALLALAAAGLALPIPARGEVVPWQPAPDLLERGFRQLPGFRP
ncbi:hypothetical protein [Streptomyces sp. NPDC018347]